MKKILFKPNKEEKLKIVEEIKLLSIEGFNAIEIKEKLNLNRGFFSSLCKEYNVSVKSGYGTKTRNKIDYSENFINKIKKLFNERFSAEKISKELNISVSTLNKICKKFNIINPKIDQNAITDNKIINIIIDLYNEGYAQRSISVQLNLSYNAVNNIFKKNNFILNGRKIKHKQFVNPKEKECYDCNIIKNIDDFRPYERNCGKGISTYYSGKCIECERKYDKERNILPKRKEQQKNRYQIVGKISRRKRHKFRYENDIAYKLRTIFSAEIRMALKTKGRSKNGNSITKYLSYTINELKQHLESQFEPWMTWENHKKYNVKTWDNNAPSTWTWNIDHIIPQSDLPYLSLEDDNFKKCWALSNLRPYSAKQNVLDGISKIRHKK